MKKNKIFTVIVIIIAILMLGSWIIPASVFSNGVFSKVGYEPFGLLDIIQAPLRFFDYDIVKTQLSTDGTTVLAYSYISILLVIFITGIFYSILNKTGAYGNLIQNITKKFEKRKKVFFLGTAIFFLLFSSIVGIEMLAFILFPFFITILLKLNYSKISAFVATFGAVLLGNIVSISGSEITGINNIMYDISVNNNIVLRGLLLLLFMVIFILYTMYKKEPKIEEKEEEEEIIKNEKSYAPLVILSVIFFIILIIGSYSWYYVLKTPALQEAYDNLMASTIQGYPISKNLFGMLEPFGYWSGFTISTILVLMGLMVAFIYSLSFDDLLECCKEGIKKMSRVALFTILSLIPMVMLTKIGGGTTFLTTITGFLYNHVSKLTVPFTILSTTLYGVFIGDYFAVASVLNGVIATSYQEGLYSLAILTMQMTHGLVCLAAPTSLFLVMGLSYLKIPYQKWLSYIWKLIFILFLFTFGILLLINLI